MEPLVIFLVVLGVAAVVGLVAYILYRVLRPRLKEEKPSEEELVEEEMNRILKPIEDDETAKAVSEYKDEEDE